MLTVISINAAISKAKKEKKSFTLKASSGLFIRITPKGSALWCGKVKISGKTFNKSFGHFPEISIAMAKQQKEAWAVGLKQKGVIPKTYTVEQAFYDWYERKKLNLRKLNYLENRAKKYLLNTFGKVELSDLTAYALISAWKPLETKGQYSVLMNLCSYIRQIAIFAQNTGRVENIHDLTHISANYVKSKPTIHRPAVRPQELTDLFYKIENIPFNHGTSWNALIFVFYTLTRVNEAVAMRWDWIDFDNDVIRIPAEQMKMKKQHDIPISSQLKKLLLSIPRRNEYVFSSKRTGRESIARSTVNFILTKTQVFKFQTVHGIRSIGSSWMAEQGIPEDVAEACLAHVTGNAVRRAYQRSELLEKRRPVMQAWCDYVETCYKNALEMIKKKNDRSNGL